MIHTSNERVTQLKKFCSLGCGREKYANVFPSLADQRASRKMAIRNQKAFCAVQFAKTKSAPTVQRAFRIKSDCQSPNDDNILRRFPQFQTIGWLCKGKSTG
ncbi:DUF4817 domain-containing protein [Trichonephila clavipes]|uniref:DUF4817 domain-containing protein n=1 Tax=Trichonephila clavipes TaxID=2585209 RepID=A0A8X6UV25_TRICX|nr:DUF4817 domain-containing protein [Trichonephila clavipes]